MRYQRDDVLCVIPARMGSTRIKHKNIQEIEPHVSLVKQAFDTAGTYSSCISTDCPSFFSKDFGSTLIVERPKEISDSVSNVSHAVTHALISAEEYYKRRFEIVVTLMPAIAARSKSILERIMNIVLGDDQIMSAMTCVNTHPWVWKVAKESKIAENSWHPNDQKNSQDLPDYLIEHASIIVNRRSVVLAGSKWEIPLLLYSLPSWGIALDIDDERDLYHARALYPAMKPLLDTWSGKTYIISECASILPDQ